LFVFAGSEAGTQGLHPHMMHSSALAMPSQRELDQLHVRLAQEEQSLRDLKQHAPMAPPRVEQWRYLPQDGTLMQILVSPSVDGPKSQHVLHPGDIFTVVDTVTHTGMTFLRLQDGRGWALQSKPAGSWLSFFGGEPTTLCIPFSGSQEPDPRAGQFSRPSTLGSALPPDRPTVPQTQLRIDAAVPQSGSNRRSDVVGLLGKTAPSLGESQPKPTDNASKAPQLHVRVLSAKGLRNMDIGSFFGNKSDPYVVVRCGKEHRQTPVIDNNLDPVWTDGRDFTFDFNAAPNLLELEVFNSNMFVDDTLGKTSLLLNSIPMGKWVRKQDQLRGSSAVAPAEGELEYEVLIEGGSEGRGAGAILAGAAHDVGEQDIQPGIYKVMAGTAVYRTSTGCSDRDAVGHLAAGQQVSVQQVLNCPSEQRVRGRIDDPHGWIPLLDTSDGFRWVLPVVTKTFVVDNTWLQASCGGLGYRFSRDLNDKDVRPGELGGAPWNSVVRGEDQGDGWLKVADGRYLPMRVNGYPVLKASDSLDSKSIDETAAAEEELDRLYRELNRRMDMSR